MSLFNKNHERDKLNALEVIISQSHGGVFKRIDENREILELISSECPELMRRFPHIESWIKSNDEYFQDLSSYSRPELIDKFKGDGEKPFPRPYPIIAMDSKEDDLLISDLSDSIFNKMNNDLYKTILNFVQKEALRSGYEFKKEFSDTQLSIEVEEKIAKSICAGWITFVLPYLLEDKAKYDVWVDSALADGWAYSWLNNIMSNLKANGVYLNSVDEIN